MFAVVDAPEDAGAAVIGVPFGLAVHGGALLASSDDELQAAAPSVRTAAAASAVNFADDPIVQR